MSNKKMTHMELFLCFMAIGCTVLGIGFSNVIMHLAALLSMAMVVGSVFKHRR